MLRRTEAGVITISDPGADKPLLEARTVMCVHCGEHYLPQPGSGQVRGYCFNCMGPICGPGCQACVPTDLYLENLEKGRDPTFRPIIVPTTD